MIGSKAYMKILELACSFMSMHAVMHLPSSSEQLTRISQCLFEGII